ncbi:MAG: N-acetyl-gamma-glutamyl-phosphate reductase [Bacteroidota bacterium]
MIKKRIGIIGATGYTGSELVRILVNHPQVEIALITSESRAGEKFSDVHPFLEGIADMPLVSAKEIDNYTLDLVFLALPHGVSMDYVKQFKDKPFKIVDLSGDFRLPTAAIYQEWYNKEHVFEQGIEDAVFGSPELFGNDIKKARLVANPGCYPTSAILGAMPLIKEQLIEQQPLIVDSKSGVTGAGVKAKTGNMYSNVNDNFKAYALKNHRHTIEIQETLSGLTDSSMQVQFTPHLLPVDRGILTTIYAKPVKPIQEEALQNIYKKYYADAPFVRLRKQAPAIKEVRGSNFCDIYVTYDERTNLILVVTAIDNLVKGAAGQAVQNMNLMLGLRESEGLHIVPMHP